MAARKLLSELRRSRFSTPILCPFQSSSYPNPNPNPNFRQPLQNHPPWSSSHFHQPFFLSSFYATTSYRKYSSHTMNSVTESELRSLGLSDVNDVEDLILPIRSVISLLDGYHDLIGLPWWVVIVSSTLALRVALWPLLLLQMHKLKRISKLFPKLPPPFPPPFSGRSFVDQFSLFRREQRALGCPSYLWFLASLVVQIPCFLLWMASIRRMSLGHHPGFDIGGILWFQNLTEYPHGIYGPIFPVLIAGLHFCNVQISFSSSSLGKVTGLFGQLAKYYKVYLEFLTFPLLFIGFYIPQGSLVYWVTNSSITCFQQLALKHPTIRKKLGLLDDEAVRSALASDTRVSGTRQPETGTGQRLISAHDLSPVELLALSVKYLVEGNMDKAIPLLRLALDKDPEYVKAMVVMGQTLVQKQLYTEAIEYLECAISKLFLFGRAAGSEDVSLLIQASTWAGTAYCRQGKTTEGLVHLERLASIEEPEDSRHKAHYYSGLVILASALYNEGRKGEAVKYLRMAAAYNPEYKDFLQQCENEMDDFVDDLASSRRSDY